MTKPLLTVRGLNAFYGETQVLHGLDFDVAEGGITALLGANGAGKTSTLRALSGMIRDDRRDRLRRHFDLRACHRGDRAARHRPRAGRARHVQPHDGRRKSSTRRHGADAIARASRPISSGFTAIFPNSRERRRQQAGTLSGGEQQMLAIARALMLRPRLMLLDEPSFGLAPMIVAEVFDILRKLNDDDGMSMLLVEQNAAAAIALADQAYLLETGNLVMGGAAQRDRPRRERPPRLSRLLKRATAWNCFLHQVLAGLATGGIYACMALAIVMIYQAIDSLNFAQGEMAMFSTFIAWQLIQWGMPYWLAFFVTIAISFAAGVAIERIVFKPLRECLVVQPYRRLHRAVRHPQQPGAGSSGTSPSRAFPARSARARCSAAG